MQGKKLDRIDIKILSELQRNGRVKNVDLAEVVNLSSSPCLQRVKRLEKLGFITHYGAEVDIRKITDTVEIFTEITIAKHTAADHQHFDTEIAKFPEVVQCHLMSGEYDYLVHFVCKSLQNYQDIIQYILDSDMLVTKYFSYVAMKPVVQPRPWPIEQLLKD